MPEHSGAGEEPQSDNNKSTEPSWQSLDSNALIEALTKEVRELREVLKGQLAQVVKKDPPTKLETRQQVATILGVPIAILGFLITALAFLLAAYTFTYTGEMQAEDAANRAIQEHMKVRSDMGSSMSGLVAELRTYPERLAEKDTEVFTQYDSVADHGLATVEWIYRMRVTRSAIQEPLWIEKPLEQVGLRSTDPNADWRSSAEGWIWEYRAAIYAGMAEGSFGESNFGWCDYSPEFVELIQTSLISGEQAEREKKGGHDNLHLARSIPNPTELKKYCHRDESPV